jgi:H+/gluconate symporter-like permease
MKTGTKIAIGTMIGLVLGYTALFIYQRHLRKKANEAIDDEQEALRKLQEAQGSIL